MTYTVIINHTKFGFDAHCPELPGCHSQGDTEKEAVDNIRDAIRTYRLMIRREMRGQRVRKVLVAA